MAKRVFQQDSESNVPAIIGVSEAEFLKAADTNEKFVKDESIIPFCRVMQPASPQIGEGVMPGMFMNIATGRVIDGKTGFVCAPILHEWNYTEWLPDRGGFVRDWKSDADGWKELCDYEQQSAYQPVTKEGHVIQKARHFYIVQLFDNGEVEMCIFPFAGTALKIARAWTSALMMAPKVQTSKGPMTPAFYYYTYRVTTEENKNTIGQKWWLPKIIPVMENGKRKSLLEYPNGKEIWTQCVKNKDSYTQGEIRAMTQAEETGNNDGDEKPF